MHTVSPIAERVSRRLFLSTAAALPLGLSSCAATSQENPSGKVSERSAPIVNASEHAWVINDPRFPVNPDLSNCPNQKMDHAYSMEHILSDMRVHSVDKVVILQFCLYGTDNSYISHCVQSHPNRFAAVALLVGHRLHAPDDPENPSRLTKLMQEDGLAGLRLSPIYDTNVVWLNDPVCYPLWKRAEELGAVFNIFLAPQQIPQLADMAERFPGVKIVIDHMALINIARPEEEGIVPLVSLADFPNVYCRTSLHRVSKETMPYRDAWPYLRRLYDAFGPHRLMYGNFYELLIAKDLIPFFNRVDKEWILGRTAISVYFGST